MRTNGLSALKKRNRFFLTAMIMTVLCACGEDAHADWRSEYQKLVDDWEAQKGDDALGYEFIYLDDDDIPELVMHCSDEAWEGYDVYTCIEGQAAHLDRYDMDGKSEMISKQPLTSNGRQGKGDSYSNKKGVMLQSGGMMGSYWTKGYILEDGRLDCIFEYSYGNATDWAEDADPISYQIRYKRKDGSVETEGKEEDVQFEDCSELRDLEQEYDFSYDSVIDLPGKDLLKYKEVCECHQGKRKTAAATDH